MSTFMNDLVNCYSGHAPLFTCFSDKTVYIAPIAAMKSGAGWYAGSWCISTFIYEGDVTMYPKPYDRCSEYFATEQEASSYADYLNIEPVDHSQWVPKGDVLHPPEYFLETTPNFNEDSWLFTDNVHGEPRRSFNMDLDDSIPF